MKNKEYTVTITNPEALKENDWWINELALLALEIAYRKGILPKEKERGKRK